jgi:hypothetical protein
MLRIAKCADHVVYIGFANLSDCRSDVGFGLAGHFNQRQANFGRHKPEQAKRVFKRSRAGFPKQRGGQLRDRNGSALRTGDLSLPAGQK